MLPRIPQLLLSIVNMKLRDCYASLEALCEDLDDDPEEIKKVLAQVGYCYQESINQFKPKSE